MRILLYEDRTRGHGPIYLEYVRNALERAKIQTFTVTSDLWARPLHLLREARRSACDAIYLLTIDGKLSQMVCIAILAKLFSIKVIGNYYLYSRLRHGFSGFVWRTCLFLGIPDGLFISDPQLETDPESGAYPQRVRYVPDTYDPFAFELIAQHDARTSLSLPDEAVTVLMFGELSVRKGVDQVLLMCEQIGLPDDLHLVLAGRIAPDTRPLLERVCQQHPRIFVTDRYIEEGEISRFFCAADFVLCPYPRYFDVSSGTATRALAAGRPLIVPGHGMLGSYVPRHDIGVTYETENIHSMNEALQEACRLRKTEWYQAASERAQNLAKGRTLERYSNALLSGITSFLKSK